MRFFGGGAWCCRKARCQKCLTGTAACHHGGRCGDGDGCLAARSITRPSRPPGLDHACGGGWSGARWGRCRVVISSRAGRSKPTRRRGSAGTVRAVGSEAIRPHCGRGVAQLPIRWRAAVTRGEVRLVVQRRSAAWTRGSPPVPPAARTRG